MSWPAHCPLLSLLQFSFSELEIKSSAMLDHGTGDPDRYVHAPISVSGTVATRATIPTTVAAGTSIAAITAGAAGSSSPAFSNGVGT
jgi:hypothetical protein